MNVLGSGFGGTSCGEEASAFAGEERPGFFRFRKSFSLFQSFLQRLYHHLVQQSGMNVG